MTKPELRKSIRLRLRELCPGVLAEKSAAICKSVTCTPEWETAGTIGIFAPLPTEPDVERLWPEVGSRTFCYPRVHGERLIFLRVADRAALEPSHRNLREPPHAVDGIVAPGSLDLLLVPGVAFTPGGRRLGRGGGFYDRLLADPALRASTFGVCFAEQLREHLPLEPHDQAVKRVFSA